MMDLIRLYICPKAGLEKWLGGFGNGGRGCILKSNESHTLSHRVASYECTLCWFSWSLEFTNWWRRLNLIRDMCCSKLHASEKHSGRKEEGERRKNGWRLSSLFFLCVLLGIVSYWGSRNWIGEGENKPRFYRETRDSNSDLALLSVITPKFLRGILVISGAACPPQDKSNKTANTKRNG